MDSSSINNNKNQSVKKDDTFKDINEIAEFIINNGENNNEILETI